MNKSYINELISTNLFKSLEQQNKDLSCKIKVFIEKISPLLDDIKKYFPYYTRHDSHHGFKVCERISQILNPNCLIPGNDISLLPTEIFLLIAASYAHDLGMAVFPKEESDLLEKLNIDKNDDWETHPKLQEFLRENHSDRGGYYINEECENLNIPRNLIHLLHDLMRSHNLSIQDLDVQLNKRVAAEEKEINIKQLAIYLCIADALEFSDTRVIDGIIESLKDHTNPSLHTSYLENMKHICIGGSVAIANDGRVIFSGTFDNVEVISLAHNTIDSLERWVQDYIDLESSTKPQRLKISPQNFTRNLEMLGADFKRIGVRIKKETIINLISSNAIWQSNSGLAIKELYQNSVEACRYRAFNSIPAVNYTPYIKIFFNRNNKSITIEDNGCGMTKTTILNNFLTVGNSRSTESSYIIPGYKSLARFGIGFWSVFTIAKIAYIETAPFEYILAHSSNHIVDGLSFEVCIDKLKDYTLFKKFKLNSGTKIKLILKDDIVLDSVYEQFKSQILCTEIHTEIIIDDSTEVIPEKPPLIEDYQIFGSKLVLKNSYNIKTYYRTGEKTGIQFSIKFCYKVNDNMATFLLTNEQSLLYAIESVSNVFMTSICGFVVPISPYSLCFNLGRIGGSYFNIKDSEGFEFSIDRRNILKNKTSDNYSLQISNIIHDCYRDFLKETNSYKPENIYKLNIQSRMHGGNVYDSYTGSSLYYANKYYKDLLCFKLIKVERDKKLEEADVIYVNLEQLLSMKGKIIISSNSTVYYNSLNFDVQVVRTDEIAQVQYIYSKSLLDTEDIFIVEPTIEISMIFDNCSESRISFIPINSGQYLCVQCLQIENINPQKEHDHIFPGLRGIWSGSLYVKKFVRPDKMPFLFLGQYRVLIKEDSKLEKVLKGLLTNNKTSKVVQIIKKLKDVESGFVDDIIKDLI